MTSSTGAPELLVPARYCGPPSSGNGGWTAGALADLVPAGPGTPVTVTLRRPPPLDTAMPVTEVDGTTSAAHDGEVVATARPAEGHPRPVPAVAAADARAAEAAYPGHRQHPFPTCFVCGTAREPGDGLRIFPGPVGDRDEAEPRVAAAWTPHAAFAGEDPARTTAAVAWAALDCIGGWAGDLEERWMVLGRMTAVVDRLPAIGEEHVVVGARRAVDGRKTMTAATVYDAGGRALARAEHVWIAVDPAAFA